MFSEIALILLFIFDCALGIIIYLYNPKGIVNKILFLLLLPVTFTNLDILLITAAGNWAPVRAGYIMATIVGIFFYPIVYTLSCFFPRATVTRKDAWRFAVIFAVPVILGVLYLVYYADQPLIVGFPILSLFAAEPPGGYSRVLFILTNLSYLLYILCMLAAVVRKLLLSLHMRILKRERNTVLMILWGFMPLSVLLLFTYLVFLPMRGGIYFHLLASGLWTIYVVFLTLRFGFIDRKALVRVFIVYPAVLVIVMLLYWSFLGSFNLLVSDIFSLDLWLIVGIEVALFGSLLSPIVRRFTHSLRMASSAEEMDFHRQIKELSERMATVIDMEALDRLFAEIFLDRLKVRVFFFLVEDERAAAFHTVQLEPNSPVFPSDGELAGRLLQDRKIATVQQLSLSWQRLLELKILDDHRIRLVVPLLEGHRLQGIFLLGDPGVAEAWHTFEIEELEILSGGIPVVIERCRSHSRAIEMEKKLARIEKMAVLNEITSSVAHEVRNPISVIATSAETLASRDLEPAEVRRIAGYIQEETERILRLLNRILTYAGPSDLEPENVDAVSLVRRVFDILAPRAKAVGVRLEVIAAVSAPRAWVDREGLMQVCLNLTLNALEAAGGGGTVTCAVSLAPDGRLRLLFSDTGSPIPEEVRARLFEPFYTTKEGGTGLGLVVSQRIVRDGGGTLRFVSGEDGTGFEVLLPVPPQGSARGGGG